MVLQRPPTQMWFPSHTQVTMDSMTFFCPCPAFSGFLELQLVLWHHKGSLLQFHLFFCYKKEKGHLSKMWPAGHGDWGWCWPQVAVMLKCWGNRKWKHWPCIENTSLTRVSIWILLFKQCKHCRSESCSSATLLLLQQELNSSWKGSPEPQARPAWATCTGTPARSPSILSPHREWRRAAFPLQRNHMAQYIHILAASSIASRLKHEVRRETSAYSRFPPICSFHSRAPTPSACYQKFSLVWELT